MGVACGVEFGAADCCEDDDEVDCCSGAGGLLGDGAEGAEEEDIDDTTGFATGLLLSMALTGKSIATDLVLTVDDDGNDDADADGDCAAAAGGSEIGVKRVVPEDDEASSCRATESALKDEVEVNRVFSDGFLTKSCEMLPMGTALSVDRPGP